MSCVSPATGRALFISVVKSSWAPPNEPDMRSVARAVGSGARVYSQFSTGGISVRNRSFAHMAE